jgi:hypothetical protein
MLHVPDTPENTVELKTVDIVAKGRIDLIGWTDAGPRAGTYSYRSTSAGAMRVALRAG